MFVGTSEDTNHVYEYNQLSNVWNAVPQSKTIPKSFAKTPAITDGIQDIVYIFGEATEFQMQIYDLATNSWNVTNSTRPSYRPTQYAAVVLKNEILYIGGLEVSMDQVMSAFAFLFLVSRLTKFGSF